MLFLGSIFGGGELPKNEFGEETDEKGIPLHKNDSERQAAMARGEEGVSAAEKEQGVEKGDEAEEEKYPESESSQN